MTDPADLIASPEERRALSADELGLVDTARNPMLGKLSFSELSDLISRLRDRRDRARDLADRQGREARSKAPPAGAVPAKGNAGTLLKHHYLDAALMRVQAEQDTRHEKEAHSADGTGDKPSQQDLARKAMALKTADKADPNPLAEDGGPLHPQDPDASDGKASMADTARRTAPSGAFDHAGELPARERSRTRY